METNNKLREALMQAKEIACTIYSTSDRGSSHEDLAEKIVEIINAALNLPRRNCDVGTAEEQAQRFYKFCMENSSAIQGMCNSKCPCIDSGDKCHCLTRWEQMPYPYEEGGAK